MGFEELEFDGEPYSAMIAWEGLEQPQPQPQPRCFFVNALIFEVEVPQASCPLL